MNINTQYESTKRCDTYTFRFKLHRVLHERIIKIDLSNNEDYSHAIEKLKSCILLISPSYAFHQENIELVKFE